MKGFMVRCQTVLGVQTELSFIYVTQGPLLLEQYTLPPRPLKFLQHPPGFPPLMGILQRLVLGHVVGAAALHVGARRWRRT